MHHSAYVNTEKFYKKYCEKDIEKKNILDIGSYNVNGTVRPIFEKGNYIGMDMFEGPNVDVVANFNVGTSDGTPSDVCSLPEVIAVTELAEVIVAADASGVTQVDRLRVNTQGQEDIPPPHFQPPCIESETSEDEQEADREKKVELETEQEEQEEEETGHKESIREVNPLHGHIATPPPAHDTSAQHAHTDTNTDDPNATNPLRTLQNQSRSHTQLSNVGCTAENNADNEDHFNGIDIAGVGELLWW